jgi:2-polyprenyl-3-methyl-5-hydroxy-6-metoxy-1,4-benzoquinol methylase
MPGLNDWLTAARSADADQLREQILTGFKAGKPFTPYVPTLAMPSPLRSVVDFGCGLGRNFPYLASTGASVTGFDLPPMIERCRTLAPAPVERLTGDWAEVRAGSFDLIFASLVLQHIETDACRAYLRDFAAMTSHVYLLTRTQTDFGVNLLQLVAEADTFDAGECVVVEHDSGTHQLRVVGRTSFEHACTSSGVEHYEVLLRPRSKA